MNIFSTVLHDSNQKLLLSDYKVIELVRLAHMIDRPNRESLVWSQKRKDWKSSASRKEKLLLFLTWDIFTGANSNVIRKSRIKWQTVWIQMSQIITSRLIRIYTVCKSIWQRGLTVGLTVYRCQYNATGDSIMLVVYGAWSFSDDAS